MSLNNFIWMQSSQRAISKVIELASCHCIFQISSTAEVYVQIFKSLAQLLFKLQRVTKLGSILPKVPNFVKKIDLSQISWKSQIVLKMALYNYSEVFLPIGYV